MENMLLAAILSKQNDRDGELFVLHYFVFLSCAEAIY